MEFKGIRGFVQMARARNLTRVAGKSNIPKAAHSHSLRRLEDAHEVKLFIRSARGLILTDAGRAYLETCRLIFDSCEVAASAAQRAHNSVSGKIRIPPLSSERRSRVPPRFTWRRCIQGWISRYACIPATSFSSTSSI
ncbi:MAG: LysR family transcriptional regulator [Rhodobacteraceae bacterium]|nr:LysR family transcriptional regulator [Paracoccaceae bacterium]